MISLLLLKQLHDLSDDQVVEGWIENPCWQFLSGERKFQWTAPVALSDLTYFLKLICKKGAERLLKLSVDIFHPKIKQEEVVVDTNIREKNTFLPQILAKKVIDTCRKIANKEEIHQRQNYFRTAPHLPRHASNWKSPR